MGKEEKKRYNFVEWSRRFIILLVVVCTLSGVWLLENEIVIAPNPKVFLIWNSFSSGKNSSNTTIDSNFKEDQSWFPSARRTKTKTSKSKPPFNYLRTTQWGKQNVSAWKLIYGDLNCADNSKRKAMNAVLKTWLELVQKHEIDFAFVYGSLIGVVRNNDIIPWDHDVDVYVEYKDVLKLEKSGWPRDIHIGKNTTFVNYIPNSEHSKPVDERIRWDCQGKASPRSYDECSIQEPLVRLYNNGAFLDVLDYRIMTDTIEMVSEGRLFVTKKEHYFPLRRCIFMGFDGWCPNDPQAMLASYYGQHFLISSKRCKNGRWVKKRLG